MQKNEAFVSTSEWWKIGFMAQLYVLLFTDGMMTRKQTSNERWIVFKNLHCYAYWLLIEEEYKTFVACRFFALWFPTVVLKVARFRLFYMTEFCLVSQSVSFCHSNRLFQYEEKKHHKLTDNVLSPIYTHGKPNAINARVLLDVMLSTIVDPVLLFADNESELVCSSLQRKGQCEMLIWWNPTTVLSLLVREHVFSSYFLIITKVDSILIKML